MNTDENGLDDVFAVDEQYTDITDQPAYNRVQFRGSYADTKPYPTVGNCTDPHPLEEAKRHHIKAITCLTDAQIKTHLGEFIEENKLPKGLGTVYYVLTPPGVGVCLDAGGAIGTLLDLCCHGEKATKTASAATTATSTPATSKAVVRKRSSTACSPGPPAASAMDSWPRLDQTEAAECQDGGYNAAEKEEQEKEKGREAVEKEEAEPRRRSLEKLKPEEKEEEEIERMLEGPHDEEPNQQKCPTADGYCDEGLADLIINQLAVEQQNIVTDPLLHSWQDSAGNEVTDECRNFFAPTLGGSVDRKRRKRRGHALQPGNRGRQLLPQRHLQPRGRASSPSRACSACTAISLVPAFNEISPVEVGDTVGFDSGESIITLNAATRYAQTGATDQNYAKMKWNFGDGSPEVTGFAPGSPPCSEPWKKECAESVFHTYTAGGTYTVTLTVTDVGGNTASVSHEVTVIGPPPEKSTPPPPPAPESGGGSSPSVVGGGNPGGTTGGGTTATGASVPVPVATAAVVSHSLKTALQQGRGRPLPGQRAGRRSLRGAARPEDGQAPEDPRQPRDRTARRLRTGGGDRHRAGGDAQGRWQHRPTSCSPRAPSKGLRKVKKVPLDLRLTVRNAAMHNPATAVVTSAFTLKR